MGGVAEGTGRAFGSRFLFRAGWDRWWMGDRRRLDGLGLDVPDEGGEGGAVDEGHGVGARSVPWAALPGACPFR